MRARFPYALSAAAVQGISWLFARALLVIFARFRVVGLRQVRALPKTGIVFAANHAHELDAVLVRYALPMHSSRTPLFYPVRETPYYRHQGFGWRRFIYGGIFFKLLGAFPIRSGRHNYAEALSEYIELLREGRSVCIFPEGRMTTTGDYGEAHGGVAYLAARTAVPVVPVKISGTFALTTRAFLFARPKITVMFGAPLYVSVPEQDERGEAMAAHCKAEAARILTAIKNL